MRKREEERHLRLVKGRKRSWCKTHSLFKIISKAEEMEQTTHFLIFQKKKNNHFPLFFPKLSSFNNCFIFFILGKRVFLLLFHTIFLSHQTISKSTIFLIHFLYSSSLFSYVLSFLCQANRNTLFVRVRRDSEERERERISCLVSERKGIQERKSSESHNFLWFSKLEREGLMLIINSFSFGFSYFFLVV